MGKTKHYEIPGNRWSMSKKIVLKRESIRLRSSLIRVFNKEKQWRRKVKNFRNAIA
jgi:hypothetical protein